MKSKKRRTVIVSALFAVLCLAQSASAFYAPNLQRWVNRDPIGDEAFQILNRTQIAAYLVIEQGTVEQAKSAAYVFVRNAPTKSVDPDGLRPKIIERSGDVTVKVCPICEKKPCTFDWTEGSGMLRGLGYLFTREDWPYKQDDCDMSPEFGGIIARTGENGRMKIQIDGLGIVRIDPHTKLSTCQKKKPPGNTRSTATRG